MTFCKDADTLTHMQWAIQDDHKAAVAKAKDHERLTAEKDLTTWKERTENPPKDLFPLSGVKKKEDDTTSAGNRKTIWNKNDIASKSAAAPALPPPRQAGSKIEISFTQNNKTPAREGPDEERERCPVFFQRMILLQGTFPQVHRPS